VIRLAVMIALVVALVVALERYLSRPPGARKRDSFWWPR
jgi:hypothetical protein